MDTVRLDFCDFYPGFKKTDNFFYNLLAGHFKIEITDKPDFIIHSHEGHVHRMHTGVRIFFTVEDFAPDFRHSDYAFTCRNLDDPRHLRLPLYVLYGPAAALVKTPGETDRILAEKNRFCSFVVSNPNLNKTQHRINFFHALSRYKKVDSAGKVLNNLGFEVPGYSGGKMEFLKPYKFNIAFENKALPGYTTEKLYEAMHARCIPIYFGNPEVAEEFNPRSFINVSDFSSFEAAVERIRQIDQDEAEYRRMLDEPYFHNNTPNRFFDRDRLLRQFEKIFSEKITPVGKRKPWIHFGRWIWVKKNKVP